MNYPHLVALLVVLGFAAADHPWRAAAAVTIWALLYGIACWYWPFASCPMCESGRKYQNDKKKTWRLCRWCKGSGRRRRWGRIVWAYFSKTNKRAKAAR